jgi:hypothetical protein
MISEVQMQSGNYSAQYGSYLGLHINLVSKSGTNSLHGAVYDYIQNTALNAAPFLNPAGAPKPVQHYNQYGFDLGGPVYLPKVYNGHNKTFFFASYEKINQVQQSNQGPVSTLTSAMEGGDFLCQQSNPCVRAKYPCCADRQADRAVYCASQSPWQHQQFERELSKQPLYQSDA